MWKSIVAVSLGTSIGALLRWWLSAQLNDTFPPIPLGTLAANWSGGYIVGLAIAVFASQSALAPEWRLLVITGRCGGLSLRSQHSPQRSSRTSRKGVRCGRVGQRRSILQVRC